MIKVNTECLTCHKKLYDARRLFCSRACRELSKHKTFMPKPKIIKLTPRLIVFQYLTENLSAARGAHQLKMSLPDFHLLVYETVRKWIRSNRFKARPEFINSLMK